MVFLFRDKTPIRRRDRKVCIHYTSYKKTLQQDFHFRCGYCGSFDKISKRSFTIDHFIPQNPESCTHTIPPNKYENLVYSCAHCNSAKSNKWPTNDPSQSHDGKKGFVDPVELHYSSFFHRNANGDIELTGPICELAIYIRNELQLARATHAILWKLERVDNSILEIKKILEHTNDPNLKEVLNEYLAQYHELTQELFK